MSATNPTGPTPAQSSTADDAEYARSRVEEITEQAAEDEAAIQADDAGMSLEEAVGQARDEGSAAEEAVDESGF